MSDGAPSHRQSALYVLFDNCNSLHTNAYDEAITTPTEESVRRAVAIQMIINKEPGLNFNENPWQSGFIVDTLTDIVEEAVYKEFEDVRTYQGARNGGASDGLKPLQHTARKRENLFATLVEAVRTHNLGQISHALYEVPGEYRRKM